MMLSFGEEMRQQKNGKQEQQKVLLESKQEYAHLRLRMVVQ